MLVPVIKRILNWWKGYFQPEYPGAVEDPPVCECGHYKYIHPCYGWARDQWLRIGSLTWNLRCRCKR